MKNINKDLEMVMENGLALEFVETQTEEICLAAVKQTSLAFPYVNSNMLTDSVCLELVKKDGILLSVLDRPQTFAICLAAVKEDYCASSYIKNRFYRPLLAIYGRLHCCITR